MTTKSELITTLKTENPTLRIGDEDRGYTDLSAEEYEATILQWADNLIAKEEAAKNAALAKENAQSKLAAIGLSVNDLKALGL